MDDMGNHSGSHGMSMTGSTVLDAVLLVVLLAAAALSLVTLLRGQHVPSTHASGPRAEVAHIVMNLAMAWMLTPWWGDLAALTVVAASAATAAAFLVLLVVRDRTLEQRAASGYHLLASAVLAGTALAMSQGTGDEAMASSLAALWWALAVLFALDLVGTIVLAVAPPASVVATAPPTAPSTPPRAGDGITAVTTRAEPVTGDQRRALRVAALPHACMDVGMVAMLIALA